MHFDTLVEKLTAAGWKHEGSSLMSPTRNHGIHESDLLDPLRTYGAAARRREHIVHDDPARLEYGQLLDALSSIEAVGAMARLVDVVFDLAQPWALAHGARTTRWEFSLPCVSMIARHPDGGLGCLEAEVLTPSSIALTMLRWQDDHGQRIRNHYRTPTLPPFELPDLLARLDQSLRMQLLPPWNPDLVKQSSLSGDDGTAAAMTEWEQGFDFWH